MAEPAFKRSDDQTGDWTRVFALVPDLPQRLSKRARELSEDRIQVLMDAMLDVDPFEPVEARIDARNAALRADFLQEFEVLGSADVHRRAGLKGANTSQTVNGWRLKGRVLGLPVQGRIGYPAFQFDADGQPIKLMAEILRALPVDYAPWQRAFWMVSPQEALEDRTPLEALQGRDRRVIEAARAADQRVAG